MLSALFSAFTLFVLGWLSYAWLLMAVTVGSSVTVTFGSVDELSAHRLWTSFSFALLGLALSAGVGLCRAGVRVRVLVFLVALAAVLGWLMVLKRRMVAGGGGVSEALVFLLRDVPLYEVGVFASVCVLAFSVVMMAWMRRFQVL